MRTYTLFFTTVAVLCINAIWLLPLPDAHWRLPEDLRLPIEDQDQLIKTLQSQDHGHVKGEQHPHATNESHSHANPLTRSNSLPPEEMEAQVPVEMQTLYEKLQSTPMLLSKQRLRSQSGVFSCGGSGTVVFKSWQSMVSSTEGLEDSLPEFEPSIANEAFCLQNDQARCEAGRDYRPNRCAIVGNSGKLRESTQGSAIDSADFVLRFNSGRTKGFEALVGRKSHARMYNGPYAEAKQANEITLAQLRDPSTRTWVKSRTNHPGTHAYMFDPEFLCLAWDWVDHEGDKPSSGMVGVLLGMKICKRVDVYGFDFSGYFNKSAWSHYYDKERPKPGREKAHPFEKELNVYKRLEESRKLFMHY